MVFYCTYYKNVKFYDEKDKVLIFKKLIILSNKFLLQLCQILF